MGAKQNGFVIGLKDQSTFAQFLALMAPVIEDALGPLQKFSVVNPRTQELRNQIIQGDLDQYVRTLADDELGRLYPTNAKNGSVGIAYEGRFIVVGISRSQHDNPANFCHAIWRTVGSLACAVLVGEELEVSGEELEIVLTTGRLPESMNLCEAAIVRASGELLGRELVEHHGVQLK